MQIPLPPSHDLAHVDASLHALKQLEHVQEEAAGKANNDQSPCLAANLTGLNNSFLGGDMCLASTSCTAGSCSQEDCLILAGSRLSEPKLAEADQLSSHASSICVNHGSLSSFAAKAPLHHQYHDNDNGETDAPPVLHSMPAKRKSMLAWPLLKGAQDDLHHSLLSAAHAAEHPSLLLSNDGYADDLDSAQRDKLWHSISNMLAALWQFLCGVAGALSHWSKCCPTAAEPVNTI